MRIVSWNINGIRTVPQYHPWNTFKTWDESLRQLGGDIICVQEVKSTRAAIGRNFALPDSFDAFFSFPTNKAGYSGVAVYTDRTTALPLKVEEGLSGKIQPKPPLPANERISLHYPLPHELKPMEDAGGATPSDFAALDSEGRALALDFGLFVLINLYCPNETSDERLPFKMNYHYMMQERVRQLVQDEGREVIVTGDINICSAPIDHCDGHLPSNAESFYDHPARQWLQQWLEPNGKLIDVTRRFWPDRKGMYTCWNTKISARETNYGTRIDYFLVTPGLLPWIAHSDIQPSIKGSDHCPVFLDFHNEIILPTGEKRSIRDAMQMNSGRKEPPRLASKFWAELQGKQTLMSSFFVKQGAGKSPAAPTPVPATAESSSQDPNKSPISPPQSLLASAFDALDPSPDIDAAPPTYARSSPTPPDHTSSPALTTPVTSSPGPPRDEPLDTTPAPRRGLKPSLSSSELSRKRPGGDPPAGSLKPKKAKTGQAKLSSFFMKPSTAPTSSPLQAPSSSQASSSQASSSQEIIFTDEHTPTSTPQEILDADMELARSLSESDFLSESDGPSSSQPSTSQSKQAWSELFAPIQPPNCIVHGEPAKEYRVNKPGPNKGKVFFLCSRPVGPGYDKGKGVRAREEVDYRYKCNYFKWASDVKKESSRTVRPKD